MSQVQGGNSPTVREQLIGGAIKHIRATGVSDLSTRSLATAGGRSTMCLYTKFQSRQGLIDAVFEDQAAALVARLEAASDPVTALWDFAVKEPQIYSFLFDADLDLTGVNLAARSSLISAVIGALAEDPREGRRRWAAVHGMAALARSGQEVDFAAITDALKK